MPKSPDTRDVSKLSQELALVRSDCERVGDMFTGLAILFAAVGALVVGGGVWLHAPAFVLCAALAFASALAFSISARSLGQRGAAVEPPAFVIPPQARSTPVIVPFRKAA